MEGLRSSFNKPLVLATQNEGKIAEFRGLLVDFDVEIRSLKDFGPIPQAKEDGETFEENAVKKARFTAKVLGLPTLADDSGLRVKALGGMPGVRSARYAGQDATDERNNLKLLRAMESIEDRSATFVCVIAVSVPSGASLIYKGTCKGLITRELTGTKGFGYDPLFYYPPLGKTFAQMPSEEKNRISHRGRAMAALRHEFDKVLIWLNEGLAEEP
ncbi:MAG: XTP/dITP diphosphatase [Pseudomonadota bacterium]